MLHVQEGKGLDGFMLFDPGEQQGVVNGLAGSYRQDLEAETSGLGKVNKIRRE